MNKALRNTTVDEQKYYLAFNLLSAAAPYLSDDFVDADFEFYGKVMSGKQEQQPRWKRSLNTVNGALGEAVGDVCREILPGFFQREKDVDAGGEFADCFERADQRLGMDERYD